jgi:ribosome-associated translation inhibitor RaiA
MQIQVNSGNSFDVDDEVRQVVEANVSSSLGRFGERLTRVEVHLNDLNSSKSGSDDKRCQIEARPAGLDPVSASDQAATIEEAVRGATQKLQRLLDSMFGRLADKR